jgi:hypothetical protein
MKKRPAEGGSLDAKREQLSMVASSFCSACLATAMSYAACPRKHQPSLKPK